jgi:carnitine 3-dehydrogenase
LDDVMADAVSAWDALGLSTDHVGSLTLYASIEEAVADAGLIQESVPERLDTKHSTLAAIDAVAPADAIIASSTSGYKPTDLATSMSRPDRLVVAHPFNPVYLLPHVPSARHAPAACAQGDRCLYRRPSPRSRVA